MTNETTVIATSQDIPEFPVLVFDTTGPMGGDAGYGGNAYIGLVAGTTGAGLLVVDNEGNDLLDYELGDEDRVLLSVCGDWETGALEDAICELADEIRARKGKDQGPMTEDQDLIHIGVERVSENEDGGATYKFHMSDVAAEEVQQLGLKMILYCGVTQTDIQDVFDWILSMEGQDDD